MQVLALKESLLPFLKTRFGSLKNYRTMTKIPKQYKRGRINFLGCKIDLSQRVFIPRPETEYWVKKAIEEIQGTAAKDKEIKVLDIFSGSGCIGIALLKHVPGSIVDFVDLTEKAVGQIRINLKLNEMSDDRFNVHISDVFSKLKDKSYHFILSNPPYVAEERIDEVDKIVLDHEPREALFAGKKGLYYIRKLISEAKSFLKKEGGLYVEFDPRQKDDIEKLLKDEDYKEFSFYRDQFKKFRWLKAVK
ncbi:MAG: HemK family protein methyltransferase [Candidatus Nealsonbacteria bacterium]|nr:HemK family protein methyltransferase [Candidatus Nealsonbacteria bacterium]